jgi:hypothetical protein
MANRFSRIEESLLNLYHNTMRFHWTHQILLEQRSKIFTSEDYQKLLRIEKCHMNGVLNASWRYMSRLTTHAYLCVDGLFRPYHLPGYTGYDQPFDSTNRSLIPDSCITVWSEAPDHVFSITGKSIEVLDQYKPDWIKTSHTIILPIEKPFKEFVEPAFNLTEDVKEPC